MIYLNENVIVKPVTLSNESAATEDRSWGASSVLTLVTLVED